MQKAKTVYKLPTKTSEKNTSAPRESDKQKIGIPPPSPGMVNEVKQELAKEAVKQSLEQEERLKNLTRESQHVLYKCQTVFPFDFFPDVISIEPTQVNVRKKTFYGTDHLLTIPIKNISDVHLQTTPFFSSLQFVDRSYAENTLTVDYLRTADAERVRKIVQGLIIAMGEAVDVGRIKPATLKKQAEKLGNMQQIEE